MGRRRFWLRIFEKKRGHRRTVSPRVAFVIEAAFFTSLIVIGIIGVLIIVVGYLWPYWRATHQFRPHWARVLDTRIAEQADGENRLFRPEIFIEYELGGTTYQIWTYDVQTLAGNGFLAERRQALRILRSVQPGRSYRIYYDPENPAKAVLVRGIPWWIWVVGLVPISFLLLGIAGLTYLGLFGGWLGAVLNREPLRRRRPDGDSPNGTLLATLPKAITPQESPGTRLAVRLPVSSGGLWTLGAFGAGCLLWNGLSVMLAGFAIQGVVRGRPDWVYVGFVAALLAVGIFWAVWWLRQVWAQTMVGPTVLEVSQQPFLPGQEYQLFISQSGRLKLDCLEVQLVCDERAMYCQGTEVRVESRCVVSVPILRREAFQIEMGVPFEALFPVSMPAGAMHSFRSAHNEIRWSIVVSGSSEGSPCLRRVFFLAVYPPGVGTGA